jgi:hypothetical protein
MLPCCSRKRNHWLSAGLIFHFNVAPTDSFSPARAESFHRRFFRGKSRGVPLEFIFVPLAVTHFRRCEHALEKCLSVPPDRHLDAVNLRDVYSQADDHRILQAVIRAIRRRIIPL